MRKLSLSTVSTLDIEEVLTTLNTQQEGLSQDTARKRLESGGLNRLPKPKLKSLLTVFALQFNNALIWLLVFAAIISFGLGRLEDAIMITFILILNAAIGTYQEYTASHILANLDTLSLPKTKVKRDGVVTTINTEQLVVGDIIILEAGNHVPADCRLLVSHALETNESTLTGESMPVNKTVPKLLAQETLAKITNCAYMGTTIVGGRGEAVVFATGIDTQLGTIAQDLVTVKPPKTPLQEQIADFSKTAIFAIAILIVLMMVLGVISGESIEDMFLTSISLAVAAIPEGLPVLITIVLVFGIKKMAVEKALVQKQMAIQTLGQVQVLVTDKTGTLTENVLNVSAVCIPKKNSYHLFSTETVSPFTVGLKPVINAAILANNASGKQHINITDDPVDQALLTFSAKFITTPNLKERLPRIFEIPFDSDRKVMISFHRKSSTNTHVFIKGATRQVIALCKKPPYTKRLNKIITEQTSKGDKAIATAELVISNERLKRTDWQVKPLLNLLKGQAQFTGVLFLNDPIRKESAKTIEQATQAGIKVIMATGDNQQVAYNVGQQIGLAKKDIWSEITPNAKLELIKEWQDKGYVVAMTGDGVNDAPALKIADVGLAMGKRGTDIARDTADIIMLDDNIATIVKAVSSGRTIFRNIQKVIAYLLASNTAEILVLFLTVLTGGYIPLPLLPAQILWVNLVTDSITIIPLAIEPEHDDVMKKAPRKRTDPLLSPIIIHNMFYVTTIIVLITLGVFTFFWLSTKDIALSRTAAFFVLATTQAFNLLNARSVKTSIFKLGLHTNPAVIVSLISAITLQILIMYIPFTQRYLHLIPLSAPTIISLIAISSLILWLMELKKHLRNQFYT